LGAHERPGWSRRLHCSRDRTRSSKVSDQQAALALGDSSRWLRYGFGDRRRSALTSLMMSRRASGPWFTNSFIIELMAMVMTATRTIDQAMSSGFRAAIAPANSSSSFAMLAPAQVVLGCIGGSFCARLRACKRPALRAGLGEYSDFEWVLGRLHLGRHGTSRQGFVLLVIAAGDVCVRQARVHNVRAPVPAIGECVGTPAPRSGWFQCWSGSTPSTIC